MIKYLLIVIGVFLSALAQIFLKRASIFEFRDWNFIIYFISAGLSYVVSFVVYSIVLKYFPISKASPVMTLGTMAVVILAGIFLFKEIIHIKEIIGLLIGIIAIVIIVT